MTSEELRKKYIKFFVDRGHKEIPPASLMPENDPSTLFTTAGMQALVPYLSGKETPPSQKVTNVQDCIRTNDIEEVGDTYHHTFFEMLGNWSIGDPSSKDGIGKGGYWKVDAIKMAYEFCTAKEWLNIPLEKLAFSVFAGDSDAPFDQEAFDNWVSLGVDQKRIVRLPKKNNWWGQVLGPCGPNTEIFYWSGTEKVPETFDHTDTRWVEMWNLVFMEFERKIKSVNEAGEPVDYYFDKLAQKNIDTGMGLERTLALLNGLDDNYQTDLFWPIIEKIQELSGKKYEDNQRAFRIIADHMKAAVFLAATGIVPANIDRGYIMRRLIRRAVRYGWLLDIKTTLTPVIGEIIRIYGPTYKDLKAQNHIIDTIIKEEDKFKETLEAGLKKADTIFKTKTPLSEESYSKIMQIEDRSEILKTIYHGQPSEEIDPELKKRQIEITNNQIKGAYVSGKEAFDLYQTYGFPLELILDLAQNKRLFVGITAFRDELKKHQELSRTASVGMFKGGLVDQNSITTRMHTATHLLLKALQEVLGPDVHQRGSNINEERIRFDFSYDNPLTPEEIKKVEEIVNEKIKEDLPVTKKEATVEEAKEMGAEAQFIEKYKQYGNLTMYSIGDYSHELCGGPHVERTGQIGGFKIIKEESSSGGVRRIRAILE